MISMIVWAATASAFEVWPSYELSPTSMGAQGTVSVALSAVNTRRQGVVMDLVLTNTDERPLMMRRDEIRCGPKGRPAGHRELVLRPGESKEISVTCLSADDTSVLVERLFDHSYEWCATGRQEPLDEVLFEGLVWVRADNP